MMAAEHDPIARAIARDTGTNWDSFAAEHGWAAVGIGPVGQHRDSDALERSNWRVILPDLEAIAADAVAVASFGHWAVGWVEEIAHDLGSAPMVERVAYWRDRLADYPVADESDYSDLEWEDNHPADGRCYADESEECPCGLPSAYAPVEID